MSGQQELRGAAVAAAREARAHLAEALPALQADGSADPVVAEELEGELTHIIGRLFAAETAREADAVLAALGEAMEELRAALVRLQALAPEGDAAGRTTDAVARTLATLYPARQELLRATRPEDVEPIPLTRRREHASPVLDRRSAHRTHVEADIGFHSESNFYTGFSGDLSSGGLFVATWDLLEVGTELTVSFVLPGGHQITAQGHVSWVREPVEHDGDLMPGMGIEFEGLSAPDHAAVVEFLSHRAPLFYER